LNKKILFICGLKAIGAYGSKGINDRCSIGMKVVCDYDLVVLLP